MKERSRKMKGYFIRKAVNADEVKRETERLIAHKAAPDRIKIIGRVTLSKKAFNEFQNNFLTDYDFIIARTDKCTVKDGIWNAILVTCKDSDIKFAVSSEGFRYARYVALV